MFDLSHLEIMVTACCTVTKGNDVMLQMHKIILFIFLFFFLFFVLITIHVCQQN